MYTDSNNAAEYEALLHGLRMAVSMGIQRLEVRGDSNLAISHITGDLDAKDPKMARVGVTNMESYIRGVTISYITYIIHHILLAISHHNMPWKNKLDVLYFVVASFTWLLRASSKNLSCLRIKTTTWYANFYLPFIRTLFIESDPTKVGETDTR